MFTPKKTKYKKECKGRINLTKSIKNTNLTKGNVGLIVRQSGILTNEHINTLYKNLKQKIKKTGTFFFNVFPHHSKTFKSSGTRMGSGKGNIGLYFNKIRANQKICEFALFNQPLGNAIHIGNQLKQKLPISIAVQYRTKDKKIILIK